ncbi:hypothetical protein ACQR1W_17590 [Bradyrhizobium sp. HKCCYLS1011]|uniref:hypothetical protein n=1 Tax=Bradyrhizobium sp. HKCCYLS1011 TaxID=3420733 RepID=UPI003EC1391A
MSMSKLFAAAMIVSAASLVPTLSEARSHHRHHYGYQSYLGLPYPISYLHNYGPGPAPESFAYYDGPSTNRCYQSSAAYIGQDGRRHPCF